MDIPQKHKSCNIKAHSNKYLKPPNDKIKGYNGGQARYTLPSTFNKEPLFTKLFAAAK